MHEDAPAKRQDTLLLVNLGTPAAATAPAVRRYLWEFLRDPRVVQLPRWLWWPLLRWLVLPLRAAKVAGKYAEVWMDRGSPLAVHTGDLAAAVQARLPDVRVAHAMRYGEPALSAALDAAHAGGGRVLVLPLYPQYSTTTTASVADLVAARGGGAARMVGDYHVDPGWVAAVADSIRAHRAVHGSGEILLFSFHGIPQRLADAGDPYPQQCRAGVEAIVAELGLAPEQWRLAFQSRFGREQWLLPATDQALQELARDGVTRVDVVCPGFSADCLETLEEIAIQNAALHRAAGGESLAYIPCLNASPAHADAIAAIARREFDAWR